MEITEPGEEPARPVEVISVGADGNRKRARAAVLADVRGESLEFRGVVFRREISATSPGLIAHPPVADAEGGGRAVLGTLAGQRAVAGKIAVFHPVSHFPRRPGSDVSCQIRLGA